MKVVKYILGSFLIIAAFGSFLTKEIVAGILISILGLILLPPISTKIKEHFNLFQNKIARYTTYLLLFVVAGGFMDTKNLGNKTKQVVVEKSVSKTKSVKPEKVTEKQVKVKPIKWNSEFSKNEVLGKWLLERYYYENKKATYLTDGDEEQKQLSLTRSRYQTSYPNGSGENMAYDYTFNGNYMSVVIGKQKTEIYGFQVYLSEDKSMLFFKGKDGLFQVFKRKK